MMHYSAVLIIPDALKAQADTLGAKMGWGPVSYTIPLVSAGFSEDLAHGKVTHWACRADVSDGFVATLNGERALADDLNEYLAVLAALIADFSPDPANTSDERSALWGREHLNFALERHAFRQIRSG